jgi:hypothetical protein
LLYGSDLKQATASLPFPVIGVPWNQVLHLPDALAIGHEVGHSVEADFDLGAALNALIDEALTASGGQQRVAYWKAWKSEVFADVYGCLSGGPPFACALADFLLADPAEVQARRPALTAYPPETLRVRINACILEKMGFDQPAAKLIEAWDAEYPLADDQADFAKKDAPEIAERFLDSKLDALGGSLRSALTFDDAQYDQARKQAARASDGKELLDFRDLRVTLAAARIGYAASPKSYYSANGGIAPAARLEERMSKLLSSDLRSGETARSQKQQQEADRYNLEFGRQQAELLLQAGT